MSAGTGGWRQLEEHLNRLGSVGWEVCGFASVDKTIGLNSVTAMLKRELPSPMPPVSTEPAWLADPLRRHEVRWWNGARWTEHVIDAGKEGTDAPVQRTG